VINHIFGSVVELQLFAQLEEFYLGQSSLLAPREEIQEVGLFAALVQVVVLSQVGQGFVLGHHPGRVAPIVLVEVNFCQIKQQVSSPKHLHYVSPCLPTKETLLALGLYLLLSPILKRMWLSSARGFLNSHWSNRSS
jgi:hypothetical protein